MPTTPQIPKDIQPNILKACKGAFASRLHLYRFTEAEAARNWLRDVTARVFETHDDARTWLNVSFTYPGLRALSLDPRDLADFPDSFRLGMARRASFLGDPPGSLDPTAVPHAALLVITQVGQSMPLYAQLMAAGAAAQGRSTHSGDALRNALAEHLDAACGALGEIVSPPSGVGLSGAPHDLHHALVDESGAPATVEYFGFRDGISKPSLFGSNGEPHPQFIIQDPELRPDSLLSQGTFMVARQLEQNVELFWSVMQENAPSAGFEDANELAEFLLGRRRNGQPLGRDVADVATTRRSIVEGELVEPPPAFEHRDEDERAAPACPFQSHVRRVNPRLDPADPSAGPNPQILRRGMSYYAPDGKVGLMFMAFNSDIARQFEFIQGNWIQRGTHVGGLSSHSDPISSNVRPVASAPQSPAAPTFVAGRPSAPPVALRLPDFVTLKWGDYFFVPARAALERMSAPPRWKSDRSEPRELPAHLRLHTVLDWINDSQLARSFWDTHVPEQGLRLGTHVFVKDSRIVRQILGDRRASQGFSVCEYGRKLRSISGPFVLGLDVDTQDYQREVRAMRVIPVDYHATARLRETVRRSVERMLYSFVNAQKLRSRPEPLRSGQVIAFALSSAWEFQLGLPGPSRASLLTWAQEITDAVFRQGQDAIKMARAEQTGKELRGYVLDRIVETHSDPQGVGPLHKALEEFAGMSDDDIARILTGILTGGLTAVAGTFVPGLARLAVGPDGADPNLALTLKAVADAAPDPKDWPLYRHLAAKLETDRVGGPDYLFRTFKGAETKLFELDGDRMHIPIEPGDTTVAWIGGAARPRDTPDSEIRFGSGDHMCPGREAARAIIDGVLAALSDCTCLTAVDGRGLAFELTLPGADRISGGSAR